MRGPIAGYRVHLITAVVGLLAAAAVLIGFVAAGGGLPSKDPYRVKSMVATSAALTPGARVTMAGARVGHVSDVKRSGIGTVVEMEITDDRVTPIPKDSRVTLRQRTPVGENYISIKPGSSREMLADDDGVLPVSQSDEYVDVDEILSVLRGRRRERARELFQGLGTALEGRGQALNELTGGTAQTLEAGANVFAMLAEDRAHVAGLVDKLGSLADAVGERGETVQAIARQGLRSMRALGARDEALRRTLDQLPSTLGQVRRTSGTLASVTDDAAPVLRQLARVAREVRPGVDRLRPAAQQGREVVRELGRAARPLQGTLERLTSLSRPASRMLPEAHKALCEANPVVRYFKPYVDDAIMSLVGLGSASNSYDAIGHLIRLSPIVGENSLAGYPPQVTAAAYTLMRAGFLQETHGLTWNPYPEPGKIGKDGAGKGKSAMGPKQVAESGWKYPRVTADC